MTRSASRHDADGGFRGRTSTLHPRPPVSHQPTCLRQTAVSLLGDRVLSDNCFLPHTHDAVVAPTTSLPFVSVSYDDSLLPARVSESSLTRKGDQRLAATVGRVMRGFFFHSLLCLSYQPTVPSLPHPCSLPSLSHLHVTRGENNNAADAQCVRWLQGSRPHGVVHIHLCGEDPSLSSRAACRLRVEGSN